MRYGIMGDIFEQFISKPDLCREIHKSFNIGIIDNHLSFACPFTGRLHFSKLYAMYFSDLLVEKQGDIFVVIESKSEFVDEGMQIDSIEKLYPTRRCRGRGIAMDFEMEQ